MHAGHTHLIHGLPTHTRVRRREAGVQEPDGNGRSHLREPPPGSLERVQLLQHNPRHHQQRSPHTYTSRALHLRGGERGHLPPLEKPLPPLDFNKVINFKPLLCEDPPDPPICHRHMVTLAPPKFQRVSLCPP